MQRKGVANLPLHGGHAPRWLFNRMVKLAGAITDVVVDEYGPTEFIHRISNPCWFQAFSCVLGFDWHSSGTTTTALGALKSSIKPEEHGIYLSGGKGAASRKTPDGIVRAGDIFGLNDATVDSMVNSSRLSAKIDNSCIQDGYNLYVHDFFVTEKGDWAVVQQGMNTETKLARRYHWMNESFDDFLADPHSGISCDNIEKETLNMASTNSKEAQKISVDLINDNPVHLRDYFKRKDENQLLLTDFNVDDGISFSLPKHHAILDMDLSDREYEVLKNAWEIQPENYEELILLNGIGPKKIRALALISDLVFGEPASWKDPVKYSFTHGGKDGFPYPVDRDVYDNSISMVRDAVYQSRLDKKDKMQAFKRLDDFIS
ncbi:MAG: DUF763 domain-containing protein [archaeon]|nr:DUF763 domain-containing protein [archaeon]